jgi:hypothetical protein
MMVCFVVLSASRRGGLVGQRDLGPAAAGGGPEDLGVGLDGFVGEVVVAGVAVILLLWRRVTGIKLAVAEA